jgi:hypothetical protein
MILTAEEFHKLSFMVGLLRSYNSATKENPHLADLANQMADRAVPFSRRDDGSIELELVR